MRGEKLAQQRFYEAEADVEVRHLEKRNSDVALYETQSGVWIPNDYSFNRRINGLIRLKEKGKICVENWKWGIDSSEKIKQKIAKKLKNWEEFVAKKQIEQDQQGLMICLCIKSGILRLWVNCWLEFRIDRTKQIPCQMRENFTILKQRAALERATFPVNPLPFQVPGLCLAAILDCRTTHGKLRVLQETFVNDCLLEKDKPILSSTIQRIWQPLLWNWDLIFQEIPSDRRVEWDENRRIRQYLHHASKVEVESLIILVELILTVVWLICIRNCIWESFLTLWNFKAGKSTSKLKYVQNQQILISQCNGPKKVEIAKSIDELVTSRSITGRRDFSGYDSLMRWLRLHWKDFSTSMFAFEKEFVSKSSALKSTTDSYEGDKIAYMIY